MKPFEINQLNRLCREQRREFHPTFGTPVTQRFGDTPDPGTSSQFASADHRHGLEELPDDTVNSLDLFALVSNEFMYNTAVTNEFEDYGTASVATIRDVAGRTGGFGTIDHTTGTAADSGAGVVLTQVSSATITTNANTFVPRIRRFETRVRPVLLETDLPNIAFISGGFLLGTHARANTATSGVFWLLETDVTGAGTYHCQIRVAGSTTFDVDSGLSPSRDGVNVLFEHFRIEYDGETVSWYFGTPDDSGELTWALITSTAVADTPLPGTGNLVCGWGSGLQTTAAIGTGKTMVTDNILVVGLRVAVE